MGQKVVVIGHSYSSRLSIIRSVAEVGCDVTVIVMTGYKRFRKTLDRERPIDCYSKYVSQVYYCHRKDSDGLIRLLLDKCADEHQKVILFPDSDDTVVAIDNNRELLADHFCFPHICNGSGSIEFWMDKIHQKNEAKKVGLNVAEGVVIDIKDGIYIIPNTIQYPCYTKPLATMNGGKGGMRRCDSEEALRKALNVYITTRTRTGKVLAEQYKEIDTEYALLGFSDGKEVVIPGILKLLVISKSNKGIALKGKVMPVDGFEDVVSRFKRLVLNIGFVGVFDIDFYDCGGLLYFCEMNLRFGGSGYAITKMGVNLPAMFIKMCQQQDWRMPDMSIRDSATYVNERMLMDDWNNGYITRGEAEQYLQNSDICFITDTNDSLPERKYQHEIRKRRVVNFIKKLRKKSRAFSPSRF